MEIEIVQNAFRIVFLFGLPMVILVSLAAILSSSIAVTTSAGENALGYAFKLFAAVAVLYFSLPGVSRYLAQLFVGVLQ